MSLSDKFLAAVLPPSVAFAVARRMLKSIGVGFGGNVAKSGEMKAASKALALCGLDRRDPVIFDVGGNVGEWTLEAKRTWPDAKVHVFEPSASHVALLEKAVGSLNSVTVNSAALGAEVGEATLYKNAEITGLASMTQRNLAHVGLKMEMSENIQVDTIDRYCEAKGISEIDFLKIDVEGHELDVLQGASGLLDRRKIGVVQFEFGGCNIDTKVFLRDFYGLFSSHGYRLHIAGPRGGIFEIPKYREVYEQFSTTNYLAVRDSR